MRNCRARASSRGSHSSLQGYLSLASLCPDQEKVGHISRGKQENDPDGSEHHPQNGAGPSHKITFQGPNKGSKPPLLEFGQCLASVQLCGQGSHPVQVAIGLRQCHAGAQPSDSRKAPVTHRGPGVDDKGQEDVRCLIVEPYAGRHDSDDGQAVSVDVDSSSQDIPIIAKAPDPVAMTQDDGKSAPRSCLLCGVVAA